MEEARKFRFARASQTLPPLIVWTTPRQHESTVDMPQASCGVRRLKVGVEVATSRRKSAATTVREPELKAES